MLEDTAQTPGRAGLQQASIRAPALGANRTRGAACQADGQDGDVSVVGSITVCVGKVKGEKVEGGGREKER